MNKAKTDNDAVLEQTEKPDVRAGSELEINLEAIREMEDDLGEKFLKELSLADIL